MGLLPAALEAFVGLARLFLHRQHDERAIKLLGLAAAHSASTRLTKREAKRLLALAAPGLELSASSGQKDVLAVAHDVLLELAAH